MAKVLIRNGASSIWTGWFWWPFSGQYWGGPLFFAVLCLVYLIVVKRSWALLDGVCVSYSFTLAIFKVACLAMGCCAGIACDLPWGIWFHGEHPTQLYQILIYFATGSVLLLFHSRNLLTGRLVLILGLAFGLNQAIVDPLVDPIYMPLKIGPAGAKGAIGAVVAAMCAGALVCELERFIRRSRTVTLTGQESSTPAQRDARTTT